MIFINCIVKTAKMPNEKELKELKSELKKLKPEDRIRRLKELEEKTKKDIVAIEDLIKDSEKELKSDSFAASITPRHEDVDIGRLFEEEQDKLEGTINKNSKIKDSGISTGYLSLQQAYSDYSQLRDIAYASMSGLLTSSHVEVLDRIGERLDTSKYKTASAEVANILVASRAVLYKVKKYAGLD